ncbi:uncharacterized protein C2845_PM07G08140 [Panicum miliaceum]|uniref:RING-type E3 ubiquitin transferase n=1 Tax=Panicum miliaceum TaxID=4540 RepID=A0A3L6SKA5_PANMI|nr:uncharacterized protein C2845_PM07G08140 [Panicum miliaceum]
MSQIELFECAFRALGNTSAGELHHGADARRRWINPVVVPQFFVCPVSNKIMENPVVIASGKTIDRSALEEWRKEHRRICPVTGEVLAHHVHPQQPHQALHRALACNKQNSRRDGRLRSTFHFPRVGSPVLLFMQVTLMPHSPRSSNEVRDALFLLHDLLNEESSAVHLIGSHPGTIVKLASVLPKTCLEPDPELDDIIVGVMAKTVSYGSNKVVFGDDQYAIPMLIARALLPMRARCAHILGRLLGDDHYNKIKISELGGFAPLVKLLRFGDKGVKTTATRAIVSLCEARENRSRS